MNTDTENLNDPAERRKSVRLKVRPDLQTYNQKYEGKTFHVIKDPVCLRYYRFNKQEHFVFGLFDGEHTLEQVRDRFESEFPPQRLEYQDLEVFARQLVTAGLVQHEQQGAGKHLFERRAKQRRFKQFTTFTNIMYLKIPVFDPDRILNWMYKYLSWIFTTWFLIASILFILSAVVHVLLHFDTFNAKLPAYQEFFSLNSVMYMWISLGIVKIIHEFGHGLSCKGFGGESHEMGVLLMCLSPALYCNVTDAWTLADKWKRIIISFAGIYVELMIAAAATFVWWNTPQYPVANNIALCVMVLCSVSTVMFNANPLMKFDGYYILADWIEVPNLREKSTKFLNGLFLAKCLGVEPPQEAYMVPWRKALFVIYAIASWIYRWVVMFGILWFLADFLGPKLKILSQMLAMVSLASMFVIPVYKIGKNIHQRGRLPDMKATRVYTTTAVVCVLLIGFFFLPLPLSRVRDTGMIVVDYNSIESVALEEPGRLVELSADIRPGALVSKGQPLGVFKNDELDLEIDRVTNFRDGQRLSAKQYGAAIAGNRSEGNETAAKRNLYEAQLSLAKAVTAQNGLDRLLARREAISKLKSPRDGVLIAAPSPDERGKLFDRGFSEAAPLFSVGDPSKLLIRVPVSPPDYRLLSDDLAELKELNVSIYVKGRTDREFHGKVRSLPPQNADTVPIQLTQRGGGPLAVKPGGDPNILQPLAQVYLVDVDILDPDPAVDPGQLANVKIHTKWRSGAWWLGRTIANAFDLGLY